MTISQDELATHKLLVPDLMYLVSALSRRRWAPHYGLRRFAAAPGLAAKIALADLMAVEGGTLFFMGVWMRGKLKSAPQTPMDAIDSNDTLSASDFFQYFNPSNTCLQVIDLIDFFLPKLSAFLKKVPL